jgi:hypothetical protein
VQSHLKSPQFDLLALGVYIARKEVDKDVSVAHGVEYHFPVDEENWGVDKETELQGYHKDEKTEIYHNHVGFPPDSELAEGMDHNVVVSQVSVFFLVNLHRGLEVSLALWIGLTHQKEFAKLSPKLHEITGTYVKD